MSGTERNQIPQFLIYIMMLMMIITGSINTIANKLQNITNSLDRPYKHEWFITFCMFFGESLCLAGYYISEFFSKKEIQQRYQNTVDGIKLLSEESRQQQSNNAYLTSEEAESESLPVPSPFQLMLPALCDLIGSTIMTFGLSMIAGSIYQMLRGSLIIFTAVFSIIFLKSKLYRHNFLGMGSVILGLVLVGVAAFSKTKTEGCPEDSSDNIVLGFCLVIFAQIFSATQFIIEENFMKKYDCPPLKAVGWEGVWGATFYIVFLIIAQNIPCTAPVGTENNFATLICAFNEHGEYFVEDTLFAFRQLGANGSLLFYAILYTCSIGVFNFVGITISKVLSSPARAVLDTIRTIVVWLFFIFPIVDKCHREQFQLLQLIGFIFLILGTVIYNEILPVPVLEFDKYLKKNLVKNKENKDEDDV